jgi:hypothetical protein
MTTGEWFKPSRCRTVGLIRIDAPGSGSIPWRQPGWKARDSSRRADLRGPMHNGVFRHQQHKELPLLVSRRRWLPERAKVQRYAAENGSVAIAHGTGSIWLKHFPNWYRPKPRLPS